jgi:hypothetical protein
LEGVAPTPRASTRARVAPRVRAPSARVAARSVADRRSRAARTTRERATPIATQIDARSDSRERRDGDESARGRCVRARERAKTFSTRRLDDDDDDDARARSMRIVTIDVFETLPSRRDASTTTTTDE